MSQLTDVVRSLPLAERWRLLVKFANLWHLRIQESDFDERLSAISPQPSAGKLSAIRARYLGRPPG
jgi:hypothetical protein